MQRGIRSRARVLLAALTVTTALVALPAAASATVATSGTGVQTQRESFVRYLSAFGGTITGTGGATYARNTTSAADDTVSYVFNGANTTYDITRTGGSGTIAFTGGVDYDLSAHFIDVSVSDPRLVVASPTATAAVVTAVVSYDPLETLIQVRNPTTPTRIDLFRVNLSSAFTGLGTKTHTWTNAPAVLTADGARAFNGGGNGSYSDGSAFGSWTFSATAP